MGESNPWMGFGFGPLFFVVRLAGDLLAVRLQRFGTTTAAVSQRYGNLLVPAEGTFAIWAVIYLLLGLYVLYQMGWLPVGGSPRRDRLLNWVGGYFVLTCLWNLGWIAAWPGEQLLWSLLLIFALLLPLGHMVSRLRKEALTPS